MNIPPYKWNVQSRQMPVPILYTFVYLFNLLSKALKKLLAISNMENVDEVIFENMPIGCY